jgi:hypothetical protein
VQLPPAAAPSHASGSGQLSASQASARLRQKTVVLTRHVQQLGLMFGNLQKAKPDSVSCPTCGQRRFARTTHAVPCAHIHGRLLSPPSHAANSAYTLTAHLLTCVRSDSVPWQRTWQDLWVVLLPESLCYWAASGNYYLPEYLTAPCIYCCKTGRGAADTHTHTLSTRPLPFPPHSAVRVPFHLQRPWTRLSLGALFLTTWWRARLWVTAALSFFARSECTLSGPSTDWICFGGLCVLLCIWLFPLAT